MNVELGAVDQARMVTALRRHLGSTAGNVAFFETHLSFVLLADGFAYKLKKAIDLGFADFTARASRRFFCDEELRINRRLAPTLYLDRVEIVGTVETPRLRHLGEAHRADADDAPVLDHAVRMRAFDPEQQWDRLAERDALTIDMVDALAHEVGGFHLRLLDTAGSAPDAAHATPDTHAHTHTHTMPDTRAARYGCARHVHAVALDNVTSLKPLLSDPADLTRLARLAIQESHSHAALADVFDARAAHGFVVECHGDLHLGNIAQVDGRPTVFDAVEFNEGFRWSDVICDVAFLVMDLRHRGFERLAYQFLNTWLEVTGDYAGLRLLPYYVAYRAMVRGKVAAIRAAQIAAADSNVADGSNAPIGMNATSGTADRLPGCRHAEQLCRDYLALADASGAPEHGERPRLILMHGLSGSGKTLASGLLARAIGAIRVRSDVERKRLHGVTPNDHSAAGSAMYGSAASEATYARLADLAHTAIEAGCSVIIDATFLARTERARFVALGRALNAITAIVDLKASPHTLRARVAERSAHGHDASDADLDVLEGQLARDDVVLVTEADLVLRVDSDRRIDDDTLLPVAAALTGRARPDPTPAA